MLACWCCGAGQVASSPTRRRRQSPNVSRRRHLNGTRSATANELTVASKLNETSWLLTTNNQRLARRHHDPVEVIELKCYSVAPDCLVVETDRRCNLTSMPNGLTRTRPLEGLDEGRKYLDGGRMPANVGLLKLRLDPTSGQLEQQLSIREIGQDEIEGANEDDHERENGDGPHHLDVNKDLEEDDDGMGLQLRSRKEQRLAERLSMRSFVIIERTEESGTHDQTEYAPGDSLERELLSSVSIEVVEQNDYCNGNSSSKGSTLKSDDNEQQQVESMDGKHRKRSATKYPKLVRRFNLKRLFGRADQGHSDSVRHEPLVMSNNYTRSHLKDNHIHHQPIGSSAEVVPLGRPESIYLWPERLAELYSFQLEESSSSNKHLSRRLSNQPPVMISYNHGEAKGYAIALHQELEQLGVPTYLDLYHIKKGQDWQDSLNFAILDCRLFVPLITPSYGETLWTSRELKLADVLAKRIVPINFGQRWPPPSLAIQFATVQYVDWLYHFDGSSSLVVAPLSNVTQPPVGGEWPRECVRAIALQLRRLLLQAEAVSWPGPAPGLSTTTTTTANTSTTTTPPHLHLDSSGYESQAATPPPTSNHSRRRAGNPMREARESDGMLEFERAARSHRARNKNDLKVHAANQQQHQNHHQAQNISSSSYNSNSNSNSPGSYGSLADTWPSPLAQVADKPPLQPQTPRSSLEQDDAGEQVAERKRQRKKSLGQRTKKALGRLRRSLGGGGGGSVAIAPAV